MGKTITPYREHHVRDRGADRSGNACCSWAKYLLSARFVPKNVKLNTHNCDFSCCFYGCEKRKEGEKDENGGREKIENVMEEGG